MATRANSGGLGSASGGGRPSQRVVVLRSRGATMLEMAVVTPLVLMLLIGIVDLGIAVHAYTSLAEAARAGARHAAVHGSSATDQAGPAANDADVEAVVRSYTPGIAASDLTVASSWTDGNNAPGSRVTVRADYDYSLASTWFLGFRSLRLSSSSTMIIIH
jgi:Flp pilus assembly protein TadG